MDFISFLDKLKIRGKLSKALYLAIFEEVHAKVLLDSLDEFLNRLLFHVPSSIHQGMTAFIYSIVGVDPKDHVSLLIKSHMIVSYEEIPILFCKLLVCLEQRDGLVQFFLMRKPGDLREESAGIDTHADLDFLMKIPNKPNHWYVGHIKMDSFEDG